MAKKKGNLLLSGNRRIIAIIAVVVVVFGAVWLLLGNPLTGYAVKCPAGNYIFSAHVEGNRNGYVAPIEAAKVNLRSQESKCVYEAETDENGDANIRVLPGEYKATVIKTGKCNAYSEEVTISSSGQLMNFRLKNCARMFNVR